MLFLKEAPAGDMLPLRFRQRASGDACVGMATIWSSRVWVFGCCVATPCLALLSRTGFGQEVCLYRRVRLLIDGVVSFAFQTV